MKIHTNIKQWRLLEDIKKLAFYSLKYIIMLIHVNTRVAGYMSSYNIEEGGQLCHMHLHNSGKFVRKVHL